MAYAFNAPTLWNFDFSLQMYAGIFMMAAAYTLSTEAHVRGDVIYRLFKPKTQAKIDLVLYMIFFFPGVLALVFIIFTRIVSLSNLPPHQEVVFAVIALAMISRLVMVCYLTFLAPARDEGLGRDAGEPSIISLVAAAVICVPIVAICGLYMITCIAIMTLIAGIFGWHVKSQIGGQTGDTCGAAQLITCLLYTSDAADE